MYTVFSRHQLLDKYCNIETSKHVIFTIVQVFTKCYHFLNRKYHTVPPIAMDNNAKTAITIPTTTPALAVCFIFSSSVSVALIGGFFLVTVADLRMGWGVVVVGMGGDPGRSHCKTQGLQPTTSVPDNGGASLVPITCKSKRKLTNCHKRIVGLLLLYLSAFMIFFLCTLYFEFHIHEIS